MSDYVPNLNKLRVRNFRTRQKIIREEDDDEEERENRYNQQIPKKILRLGENGSLRKEDEPMVDVQDFLKFVVKSKKMVSSAENDQSLFEKSENRFSSDEESEESQSSDECTAADDEELTETPFARDLKRWFFQHSIPYSHLDTLIKVLKIYHPELPACAKTFLKTSVGERYKIEKFKKDDPADNSKIVYVGISENLRRIIDVNLHKKNTIQLQFNVDGLPLYRSSNTEFWPLLGRVYDEEVIYEPFIINVHCGEGKPSCVETYFAKFIEEINKLLKDGINIREKHFDVKVHCFICDRPARAFVKCIKGHTGFYACERCQVKGYKENNRVMFPVDELISRSDDSFRLQENRDHHHKVSSLTLIEPKINMIDHFPLDFMHLGCLGVMKKLLTECWTKTAKTKLSRNNILQISQRMMNLSKSVPSEFQRTTRSLGDLGKWKATEFRFFLLYCGMCVMKDILPIDMYKHFLLLVVAFRLLCGKNVSADHVKYAQDYLERFVKISKKLYGEEVLVLNMHSLVHISDDVKNLRCSLNHITAFPFENKLGQIKKCVRSGKNPLEQLCTRMEHEKLYTSPNIIQLGLCKIKKMKKTKKGIEIKSIQFNNCELTTKPPNNCVLLKNKQVINVLHMYADEETDDLKRISINGKNVDLVGPALRYPLDSSSFNILQVKPSCNIEMVTATLSDVDCKMVYLAIFELPQDEPVSYAVPLLHMN